MDTLVVFVVMIGLVVLPYGLMMWIFYMIYKQERPFLTRDVIRKEDLARVLVSLIVTAVQTSAAGDHPNREHINGALGIARSTALACGLAWPGIVEGARVALGNDVAGLLDQTRQLGA